MRIADFKHSQYFSPMLCHTIYRVVIFSLFKQELPASIRPENWRPPSSHFSLNPKTCMPPSPGTNTRYRDIPCSIRFQTMLILILHCIAIPSTFDQFLSTLLKQRGKGHPLTRYLLTLPPSPYSRLMCDIPDVPISPIPTIPITAAGPGSMISKKRSAAAVNAIHNPARKRAMLIEVHPHPPLKNEWA